jgi:hypothetical protein
MAAKKSTRKSSTRKKASRKGGKKYGAAASRSVESAMRRRKKGTLSRSKGGRGGKVKSRKQAVAIGLAEARRKGGKVPARGRRSSGRRASARRRSSRAKKS